MYKVLLLAFIKIFFCLSMELSESISEKYLIDKGLKISNNELYSDSENSDYHPLKKTAFIFHRYIKRPSLKLENYLFPWLKSPANVIDLVNESKYDRGIVVTTGNKYFEHVVHLIRTIRIIWNSKIPIEVFYYGSNDLARRSIDYLNRQPDVDCRDLYDIFKEEHLHLKGWQAKPFAMLASRAKNVLLLDADAVLFKHPNSFFDHQGYVKKGALFFYDRFVIHFDRDWRGWFEAAIPFVRRKVLENHLSTKYSTHLMEAGAVVIDKTRNLHGLLMTCILNSQPHVHELYYMFHGEKETYWIGFEMVRASYYFVPTLAGAIGSGFNKKFSLLHSHPIGRICDNLAHFHDADGMPWWMNDGILIDKNDKNSGFKRIVDYSRAEWGNWDNLCLEETPIARLPDKALIDKIYRLWSTNVV